jgi:hypothetical protein
MMSCDHYQQSLMITDFAPRVTFHHIFSTVPKTTWLLCRCMEEIFSLDQKRLECEKRQWMNQNLEPCCNHFFI